MAVKLNLSDPVILQYPAGPPPPGVTPNFTHPDSKGPELVVAGGVLLAIMIMFITIRAYTKLHIIHKFSWDDLAICFSALGVIVLYGACVWAIVKGPVGKHYYDIRLGDLVNRKYIIQIYIIEMMLSPVLWITKFSFFLLYLQMFWPMRWLRLSIYVGTTIATVIYWSVWIASAVLVTPKPGEPWVEKFISEPPQDTTGLAILIAWVGLAIDVYLLVLPSIAVYQLQLSITRKIGIMLIFSTGLVAVVASALSIYYRTLLLHNLDATWHLVDVGLMFLIEIFLGIITNCMPSCARMFRHHLPPWATLKSNFSRWNYTTRLSGGKSQLHSQMGAKDPHSDSDRNASGFNEEDQYGIRGRAVEISHEYGSMHHFEMDGLKTVDTYIKAGSPKPVEEDGIYLKHDLHQTWSSTDYETAEACGDRV